MLPTNARPVVFLAVAMCVAIGCSALPRAATRPSGTDQYRISGPYVHENLTVFVIQGPEVLKGRNYLTLQEALEQKKVVVHETGNVNELSIENVGDVDVYVQCGDIVKGGQQDRTIASDFIAAAKAGKIPIASFCVERSRWSQRGGENPTAFSGSTASLAGKDLKLAARKGAENQGEVWRRVEESQQKVSRNIGGNAQSAESPSSLQLTMENAQVKGAIDAYKKALAGALEDKPDAIGYAFAINGKVNSVDIYGSGALFRKLWPKLLNSSAVEAVAELKKDVRFGAVTAADVRKCMTDADAAKGQSKDMSGRVKVVTRETEKNVVYETYDQQVPAASVHKSYMQH